MIEFEFELKSVRLNETERECVCVCVCVRVFRFDQFLTQQKLIDPNRVVARALAIRTCLNFLIVRASNYFSL